jgi:hypothetical protein
MRRTIVESVSREKNLFTDFSSAAFACARGIRERTGLLLDRRKDREARSTTEMGSQAGIPRLAKIIHWNLARRPAGRSS